MDLGLRGKTALVLGAGGGLGRAIAKALAEEGARVAVGDRNAEYLEPTLARIPQMDWRSASPEHYFSRQIKTLRQVG
jgi:3-oxoacyl-[acyl-carrier protein] reductase